MMKHEFEALAGYEVTMEDYNKIIEPMYMAISADKAEFVKMIDKKRFAVVRKPEEKPVFISNGAVTPNGCYYMGQWMMQIGQPDTNIRTGKTTYKVREVTREELSKIGWDEWLCSHMDLYTEDPRIIIKTVKGKK